MHAVPKILIYWKYKYIDIVIIIIIMQGMTSHTGKRRGKL